MKMMIKKYLNAKIAEIENKIPDTNGLHTTSAVDTKIREVEKKIPDFSGLVIILLLS